MLSAATAETSHLKRLLTQAKNGKAGLSCNKQRRISLASAAAATASSSPATPSSCSSVVASSLTRSTVGSTPSLLRNNGGHNENAATTSEIGFSDQETTPTSGFSPSTSEDFELEFEQLVGDVVSDISILEDRSKHIAVMQGGVVKAGRLAAASPLETIGSGAN